MTWLDVVLLGLIEGLTELLPVSSTGHLILLGELLGLEGEGAKSLDVVIQLGAIVAVAVFFRTRLATTFRGLRTRDEESLRLVGALLAAFVPTAVVGLAIGSWVKRHLFAPGPVAGALAVGGVLMIAVEAWQRRRPPEKLRTDLSSLGPRDGFVIGLCQCLALFPGASRSMTTIVGGQLRGLDTRTAAEFSFLLALPTLGAATVYELVKEYEVIAALPSGPMLLGIGLVVSFFVTWAVIAVFLRYVQRVGMTPFGVYRIGLAAVVLFML